jgi:hypothetical protein
VTDQSKSADEHDVTLPSHSMRLLIPPFRKRGPDSNLKTGRAKPMILRESDSLLPSATTRVLRQAGYNVLEAATGREALRLAGDDPQLGSSRRTVPSRSS